MASFATRLRGGARQRLGILRELRAKKERTPLGAFLVGAYQEGSLTSRELREGARAAASSAGDLGGLVSRSMDNTRTRKGKTKPDTRSDARVVHKVLRKRSCLPTPYITQIPLWDAERNCQVMRDLAVFPPHESLDALVPPGKEGEWTSFDHSQQGFREELRSWGDRLGLSRDAMSGHWMCVSIWGDSAPYTKRDSLFLLTLRVLNGQHRRRIWGAALSKRQLCDCGCHGRHTFDALFEIFAWSMKALLVGKWPNADHMGRPFQVGDWRRDKANTLLRFRAAMIAKCGDWSWHKQVLGMRGWGQHHNCWLCQSRLGDRDFTTSAAWRATPATMSAFVSSSYTGGQFLSALFSAPGFTLNYIKPDFMHTCCLGILQYCLGNVLWEVFVCVGGTFTKWKDACATIMNMIGAVATHLGVEKPFTTLVVTMLRPSTSKKPRMRLKAAEGRNLLPIVTRMLQTFSLAANEREQLRLHCCQALCRCYLELKTWGEGSSRRLEVAARQHLILYTQLGNLGGPGSLFWHLYPKHHLFVHVTQSETNPALLWNYSDEDEIGRAAKQAQRCNPKWLHTALTNRYRLL